MPIDNITLRKLLRLLYLPANKRRSALRTEIRNELLKNEDPDGGGGGDFHTPFWCDAKLHVFGRSDLQVSTRTRIDANRRRERLYPALTQGFLDWWKEETRWRNERIDYIPKQMKSNLQLVEAGANIKVENIMTLVFDKSGHMHVYPYFSESPALNADAARLGLWVIDEAFKGEHIDMRILDVLRGQAFRKSDLKFRGDEREMLLGMYRQMLFEWDALREEYR